LRIINYKGIPAARASDISPARPAIPDGSFRLYESEAEAASIAARGPAGIAELNEAKDATRTFINASDRQANTAKSATSEQGETADQVAALQGVTPSPRSLPGEVGALLGSGFDAAAKLGNIFTSSSKSTHDWDSLDPNDILTGGGKNNNRYPVLVQAAARSLAFINTALTNQAAANVKTNQANAENSTTARLNNDQFDSDKNIPGTPAYYYSRLVQIYGPNGQAQEANVIALINEINAKIPEEQLVIKKGINEIGRQVMSDGRLRYQHDRNTVRP
jgi:hypothetical protein